MYILETIAAMLKCNIAGVCQFKWTKDLFNIRNYERLLANLRGTKVQYNYSVIDPVIGLMSVHIIATLIVLAGNILRHGILSGLFGITGVVITIAVAVLGVGVARISRNSMPAVVQLALMVWFGILALQELATVFTFIGIMPTGLVSALVCLVGHGLNMLVWTSMVGIALSATTVE